MKSRHNSRIKALQILFALEFHSPSDSYPIGELVDLEGEEFTLMLLQELKTKKDLIDQMIISKLQGWTLERINLIDKNLIRLGFLELILKTADRAVIINEYINLGKKFGTENSGSFINGMLDNF